MLLFLVGFLFFLGSCGYLFLLVTFFQMIMFLLSLIFFILNFVVLL